MSKSRPFSAAAEPRAPWEVLREAHKLMLQEKPVCWYDDILDVANSLEAAAAPKPPTLAEAVRAFINDLRDNGIAMSTLDGVKEALARAEAENKQ